MTITLSLIIKNEVAEILNFTVCSEKCAGWVTEPFTPAMTRIFPQVSSEGLVTLISKDRIFFVKTATSYFKVLKVLVRTQPGFEPPIPHKRNELSSNWATLVVK